MSRATVCRPTARRRKARRTRTAMRNSSTSINWRFAFTSGGSRWCPWIPRKKELVGNFKNAGQEWQPQGQPERVTTYDFPSQAEGEAIPYGVYDVGQNEG